MGSGYISFIILAQQRASCHHHWSRVFLLLLIFLFFFRTSLPMVGLPAENWDDDDLLWCKEIQDTGIIRRLYPRFIFFYFFLKENLSTFLQSQTAIPWLPLFFYTKRSLNNNEQLWCVVYTAQQTQKTVFSFFFFFFFFWFRWIINQPTLNVKKRILTARGLNL